MINSKRILAIIPARGGSKGLPGKNIRIIAGKPLIAWTVEQAKKSIYIDKLVVSTDDDKIAMVAKDYGVDVPLLRPSKYAQDDSPSFEAVLHEIGELEKRGEAFDYLLLLEPTSPLRKYDDIDNALTTLLTSKNAESLISVGEIHMEHPSIVKKVNSKGYLVPYNQDSASVFQRQQMDRALFPYGVIYGCKIDAYKEQKSFYLENTVPFNIERWQNYEIDDSLDFFIVEQIMLKYKEHING
jgi:CMP-N,N'-diacetyllegionaminic acid synthase